MVSHLERFHKKPHKDALNLSQSIRRTKEKTKLDQVVCPIESCKKPANEFGFHETDFKLVREFQGRVSNWMKSFTEEIANRKTEVHCEDFSLLLTSTQIWNLFNSPVHEKYENRFEELDDPGAEFVELQDYLMTMLLVQSAQQTGAICNLTIDKFHAGEWDDSTGVKQFVTLTKRHKTAGTVNFVKYE
jgi:hypothetical protein